MPHPTVPGAKEPDNYDHPLLGEDQASVDAEVSAGMSSQAAEEESYRALQAAEEESYRSREAAFQATQEEYDRSCAAADEDDRAREAAKEESYRAREAAELQASAAPLARDEDEAYVDRDNAVPGHRYDVVSVPDVDESQENNNGFGSYQAKSGGKTRSTLAFKAIEPKQLTTLTPAQIGHRLWTTYQKMNEPLPHHRGDGTTASTTVFDGQGNLITATLGDVVSFVAVYYTDGNVLKVTRLNSVTHTPREPSEVKRVAQAGGRVEDDWRAGKYIASSMNSRGVVGLVVSRAIGCKRYTGVTSEATIDVTPLKDILGKLPAENIGRIQVITTNKGFTDGAGPKQQKKDHEDFLKAKIEEVSKKRKTQDAEMTSVTEAQLSHDLATEACMQVDPLDPTLKIDGSKSNITVAIQSIPKKSFNDNSKAFMLGVYDGCDSNSVSSDVARNIGAEFKAQCELTPSAYSSQLWSVHTQAETYNRDHPKARALTAAEEKVEQQYLTQLNQLTQMFRAESEYPLATRELIANIIKEVTILKTSANSEETKVLTEVLKTTHGRFIPKPQATARGGVSASNSSVSNSLTSLDDYRAVQNKVSKNPGRKWKALGGALIVLGGVLEALSWMIAIHSVTVFGATLPLAWGVHALGGVVAGIGAGMVCKGYKKGALSAEMTNLEKLYQSSNSLWQKKPPEPVVPEDKSQETCLGFHPTPLEGN